MRFIFSLIRFWLLLVFIALSGYFALYNQEAIPVSLPPWVQHISIPAYQAFSGFLLLGAALTCIFFGVDHTKKSFALGRLKKRVKELEASGSPVFNPSNDTPSRELSPADTNEPIAKDSELNPV